MKLTKSGLTPEEQIANDKLIDFYNTYIKLPIQHPNEQLEVTAAIHLIQGIFATRIARREYPDGWPNYGII